MAKEVKQNESPAAAVSPETQAPVTSGDPPAENAVADIKNRDVPTLVYVGPSLPGGLLKRYTTLRGTLEEIKRYYTETFSNYPALDYSKIERLFIPLAKLPRIKIDVEREGTLHHSYYTDIEDMIQETRKEQGKKNGGAK